MSTDLSGTTILIRLMVGAVFLSEGIQKFLFAATLGSGNDGFWEMMHGSRTDWAMLLGSIFLIIKGGGKWSLDRKLAKQ